MVYEVRCDNCGELINFGGHDPEKDLGNDSKLPPNAIEFDDNVYCEDCVKQFVEFGIGDVEDKINFLEDQVKNLREELGMEKNLNE